MRKYISDGLTGFTSAFTGFVLWNWLRKPEELDVENAVYMALAIGVGVGLGSVWRSKSVSEPEIEPGR